MKHIKSYTLYERVSKETKLFESKFDEFKYIIDTLKDICIDFEDNNCSYRIEPSNDIRIKVMALQGKGEVFQDINMPFYIDVDIDMRITIEPKPGNRYFPEWFIENCRRIEDYMTSEGFETLVSIKYLVDWENLDSIDNLSEPLGLIYKVKLEFKSLS
jgi:hypothetical protein